MITGVTDTDPVDGTLLTDKVVKILNSIPDGKLPRNANRKNLIPFRYPSPEKAPYDPWISKWQPTEIKDYFFIAKENGLETETSGIRIKKLNFELIESVLPDNEEFILSIEGLKVPKLIAVSWPKSLVLTEGIKIPFLVYIRPIPNTSRDRYGPTYIGSENLGEYPWGWDFLFYEFWNYFFFRSDPLTYRGERWRPDRKSINALGPPFLKETGEKFTFGLPYQIQVVQKPVVLVYPLIAIKNFGELKSIEFIRNLLEAILDYVASRNNFSNKLSIGRVALAGYSFSCQEVSDILANIKGSQNRDLIRELYLFDPPRYAINHIIDNIPKWYKNSDNIIRFYTQSFNSRLKEIVDQRIKIKQEAFLIEDRNTLKSVAFTPPSLWMQAQTNARNFYKLNHRQQERNAASLQEAIGLSKQHLAEEQLQDEYDLQNKISTFFDVHFAMPALLLTDALRRSGF